MHKKIWKANHSVTSVKKIISLEWLVWKTRSITLAEQKKKRMFEYWLYWIKYPIIKMLPTHSMLPTFWLLSRLRSTNQIIAKFNSKLHYLKGLRRERRRIYMKLCLGSSIKYIRKIFRKTNISNPLIRVRTCAYQRVINVTF